MAIELLKDPLIIGPIEAPDQANTVVVLMRLRRNYMLSYSENNEEDVFYCEHCLSLNIKALGEQDFCDACGSTDIKTTNIFEWEKMFENKYGYNFLTNV